MNKIFKIVFNAARGKMMVVNEATSSVQTGKKAAVTVAVVGALASGVAMAASNSVVVNGVDSFGTYDADQNVYTLTDVSLNDGKDISYKNRPIKNVGNTTLKIVGGSFTNNTVVGDIWDRGGLINSAGVLDIEGATFDGNKVVSGSTKVYGPVLHQEGSKLSVTDSVIINNSSDYMSGALNLSKTTATFTGNQFEGNSSAGGGAVMYVNTCDTTFENNIFDGNTATGSEAGISLQGGTASFDGDIFRNNKAQGGNAGALYLLSGNVAALKDVTFENNFAKAQGGAVYIGDKGDITIDGGSFDGNQASQGGAIFNTASGQVVVTGSTSFVNNQSSSYGGAVYNNGGSISLEGSEFTGNKVVTSGSDTHGGAINTVGGKVTVANSTFEANTAYAYNADGSINYASGHGGAIYARVGAELNISDSTFSGNKTGKLGGAIYVSQSKLVSSGNTYEANEANAAGVMYLNTAQDATFTGDTFTGNKALTGEAGVMSFEDSTATFEGSVFSGNSAAGKGGALMVHTGSSITFNGTNTFSGNTSVVGANDIHNNGTITFDEGSVTHLAGGITGDNVGTLAGAGSIVITDAGATISGQKDIAETLAFSATGDVNDAVGGDIEKLSESVGVEISSMEEGAVMGAVTADGEMQINTKTEALADKIWLAPNMLNRVMMNDVRKRMGDLRAAEGTHGVWARYNGGQMSGSGVDADFHMVQVGIDTVPVVDAPRFGVAFSYAQTESEDNLGTMDMDAFSLAFYGTKMYDNGMFVDVIGRMATMDTDLVNDGYKGKMDNVALSLSGELGWRFDVTDRFFFEPSAEATYTYTNADKFTMSNGGTYELEAMDSLVGRAGFAAGFKCPANKGDVYVRAAVVHEFMGDATINSWNANGVAAASLEADGKDTWFEYAIGAQFNVNKNTYVYADIERTEGATMDEDWRANVGVRFAF